MNRPSLDMQARDDCGPSGGAQGVDVMVRSSARTVRECPTAPGSGKITGLIVCVSMSGGASTLQYNLVRSLTERFLGGAAGGWCEDYETFSARYPEYADPNRIGLDPLVIETHSFDARFARLIDPPARGHVFYVYRDVRDVLVSHVREFGNATAEGAARLAETWIEWAEQWCSLANATISRREFVVPGAHAEELRRYAGVLNIRLMNQEIAEIAGCNGEPADESGGLWQRELSLGVQRRVWHVAGDWLEEHGYSRHEQAGDENGAIRVSENAPRDFAPPGFPRMRSNRDPIVESFKSCLQSPHASGGAVEASLARRARLFWGEKINILSGELVSGELAARGFFEEGLTWTLIQCLKPGDTFMDVGAHVGYFTTLGARLVGNSGRVEAFEPCPATARVLEGNVEEFSHVHVNELAAFSRAGSLVFHDLGTEHAAFNSIRQPRLEGADEAPTCRKLTIEATTLDEFCSERGLSPSFIKIDAESTELDVLRGSARLLREVHPMVSVEVGDLGVPGAATSAELLEFASEFGYQAYEYVSFGQFVPHRRRDRYSYDNLLLLPPIRCRPRNGASCSEKEYERAALRRALRDQAMVIARHRQDHRSRELWGRELTSRLSTQTDTTALMHRAYVRSTWAGLGRQFSKVALFGGGKYARWLIDEIATGKAGPRIVFVLDDGACEGDRIGSIPMVRPGSSSLAGVDAVIIATDVPDSALHKRCTQVCGSTPMVNLYAELPGGPYPKPSFRNRAGGLMQNPG